MNRPLIHSEKGLTFVEFLVSFTIFSLITVLIIGYLVSSLNNFKRVNEEIALHDEANYIMSQFVNYIFVAKKIEKVTGSDTLIEVTNFDDTKTILGFKENTAVIGNGAIHSGNFNILSTGANTSKIEINEADSTVNITMYIQDTHSKFTKQLELDSEVSYVKVNVN